MEKSQATRLGVLAALALALLMVGSYFMSTGQGPASMVVSFPSGTQMTVEVADSPLLLYAGLAFRDSLPPNGGCCSSTTGQISTAATRASTASPWTSSGLTRANGCC